MCIIYLFIPLIYHFIFKTIKLYLFGRLSSSMGMMEPFNQIKGDIYIFDNIESLSPKKEYD